MPANATGIAVGYLAGRHPGCVGHLYSPGAQRGPWPYVPYALDNGAFPAWTQGRAWNPEPWIALMAWARNSGQAPRWALVPDVVGDRLGTLRAWDIYAAAASQHGWPLAFAVQDGMDPVDVPREASVVFVGGSTEWKWGTVFTWCRSFPRVHVGRVNGLRGLRICRRAGAESCDGTGFSRAVRQWKELERFLTEQAGTVKADDQLSLWSEPSADETEPGLRCAATESPAHVGVAMPTWTP